MFDIFSDVIAIAEVLMDISSSIHKHKDVMDVVTELEEKAIAPVKNVCGKIGDLLHIHVGEGEKKVAELHESLNIQGAKDMIDRHEKIKAKDGVKDVKQP